MIAALMMIGLSMPAFAALHGGGEDEMDKEIEMQMPASWRACSGASDCVLIQYGCTGTMAVNKRQSKEAASLAREVGGNPAEIKCAPIKNEPVYAVSCLENQCFATNPKE
jgi:hypothetical protein